MCIFCVHECIHNLIIYLSIYLFLCMCFVRFLPSGGPPMPGVDQHTYANMPGQGSMDTNEKKGKGLGSLFKKKKKQVALSARFRRCLKFVFSSLIQSTDSSFFTITVVITCHIYYHIHSCRSQVAYQYSLFAALKTTIVQMQHSSNIILDSRACLSKRNRRCNSKIRVRIPIYIDQVG